jgi:uncharacterized protein (TIGR00288 family)
MTLETPNIAIFCDFENLAIGARDARFGFDISLVLERLLDKGNIVVKKAYCDWERYKSDRRPLHEASFELIEIPHVSYSGKNSADIRMVVDALDLCYTKAHVDTFAVLTGDSDFSPLVSKLRENNKKVIGVGVKNATSDLLVSNCDEFIYYDDLVRRKKGTTKGRSGRKETGSGRRESPSKKASATTPAAASAAPGGGAGASVKSATAATGANAAPPTEPKAEPKVDVKERNDELGSQEEALEVVMEITEALFQERDANLWGSMVKQTLKRKKPNFDESYYGYRTFNQLLEDAEKKGFLEIQKDEKSGGYLIIAFGPNA